MFKIFNKEKYVCLGVNPNADWSIFDSIITPMELFEHFKSKIYTKDNIIEIQKRLNEKKIPYKDLFKEFNWIPEKDLLGIKTENFSLTQVISGVRKEFETSINHIEIYEKYLAPAIIKYISQGSGEIYDISEVENDYLEKGVIVPLHFDRILLLDKNLKDTKTGRIFRNIEIKEKMEPFSLEPRTYQKANLIIDRIFEKIENGDTNIAIDEKELLELITKNDKFTGSYAELNCYYYLGVSNFRIGLDEKAENYFNTLLNIQSDISKDTMAKDFLRPIGELYEEKSDNVKVLFWYKKAAEYSPAIGLKKKIKQLEINLNTN